MAPKLSRMLYATDLSDRFSDAVRYAVNYANRHNANLIVFHVIDQRSITRSKILGTVFNEGQEHRIRQKKVNTALKRMQDLMGKTYNKNPNDQQTYLETVEHLVVHYGKIAEVIIGKANQWGCESIILGPRRKRFLGRILLPGIIRKVIRRTDKPVYVIKGSNSAS